MKGNVVGQGGKLKGKYYGMLGHNTSIKSTGEYLFGNGVGKWIQSFKSSSATITWDYDTQKDIRIISGGNYTAVVRLNELLDFSNIEGFLVKIIRPAGTVTSGVSFGYQTGDSSALTVDFGAYTAFTDIQYFPCSFTGEGYPAVRVNAGTGNSITVQIQAIIPIFKKAEA